MRDRTEKGRKPKIVGKKFCVNGAADRLKS